MILEENEFTDEPMWKPADPGTPWYGFSENRNAKGWGLILDKDGKVVPCETCSGIHCLIERHAPPGKFSSPVWFYNCRDCGVRREELAI